MEDLVNHSGSATKAYNERFQVQGSAQPPAKKTAGQIEKETMPFWGSFIREVTTYKIAHNINQNLE